MPVNMLLNPTQLNNQGPPMQSARADLSTGDAWDLYNSQARLYDHELEREWISNIDGLLIVAALFSAVLSTFYLETIKLLEEDPLDTHTQLLTNIFLHLSNGTIPINSEPFHPEPFAVRVNTCFAISLAASLVAVLLAMLSRQWVRAYDRGLARTHDQKTRALNRHYRYQSMQQWKMQELISFLPLLIHFSLFLFFAGATDWLFHINRITGFMMAVSFITGGLVYFVMTLLAAFSSSCPYKSPQSRAIFIVTKFMGISMRWVYSRMSFYLLQWQTGADPGIKMPLDYMSAAKTFDSRESFAIKNIAAFEWSSLQWLIDFASFEMDSDIRIKIIFDTCIDMAGASVGKNTPLLSVQTRDRCIRVLESLYSRLSSEQQLANLSQYARALFVLSPSRTTKDAPLVLRPQTLTFIENLKKFSHQSSSYMWYLVLCTRLSPWNKSRGCAIELIQKWVAPLRHFYPDELLQSVQTVTQDAVELLEPGWTEEIGYTLYFESLKEWSLNMVYTYTQIIYLCLGGTKLGSMPNYTQDIVCKIIKGKLDISDEQTRDIVVAWVATLVKYASRMPMSSEMLALVRCADALLACIYTHGMPATKLHRSQCEDINASLITLWKSEALEQEMRDSDQLRAFIMRIAIMIWRIIIQEKEDSVGVPPEKYYIIQVIPTYSTNILDEWSILTEYLYYLGQVASYNPKIWRILQSPVIRRCCFAPHSLNELSQIDMDVAGHLRVDMAFGMQRNHSIKSEHRIWLQWEFVDLVKEYLDWTLQESNSLCNPSVLISALRAPSFEARRAGLDTTSTLIRVVGGSLGNQYTVLRECIWIALHETLDTNYLPETQQNVQRNQFLSWLHKRGMGLLRFERRTRLDELNGHSNMSADWLSRSALVLELICWLGEFSDPEIMEISSAPWFEDFLQIPELAFQWLEALTTNVSTTSALFHLAIRFFNRWSDDRFGNLEFWGGSEEICEIRRRIFKCSSVELQWTAKMWPCDPIFWWEKREKVKEFAIDMAIDLYNPVGWLDLELTPSEGPSIGTQ